MTDIDKWTERFSETCDTDPELQAHGALYSCTYLLAIDDLQIVVAMHTGTVESVEVNPGPLAHYAFALRAPRDTWERLTQATPEPMYHGIWSAAARSGLRVEGDLLVLMQHLRSFTRQFELLRTTGLPDPPEASLTA